MPSTQPTIDDDGPAFPESSERRGMSLRAYLAGQALAGALGSSYFLENAAEVARQRGIQSDEAMAIIAVEIADCVIRELDQTEDEM